MTVSLGELDSRVFLGLAPAAEYLMLEDVHNATVQKLNARTTQSRSSDINVLLATSDEFTPDESPYDITSLIGKSVPAWLESKTNIVGGIERWFPVRDVNLHQLADYTSIGAFACAFHGEEPASDTAQPTQYVSFTYLPSLACRIRFDRDGHRTAMDGDILLPDNIAELVVLEAQQSIIPRIKLALTLSLRRDEDGRKDSQAIMAALDDVYAQNIIDIRPLDAQWRIWAFRDRSGQTSFNKPVPAGQWLYPGGRNNWGPYGGGND